jgi:hypothetical protein
VRAVCISQALFLYGTTNKKRRRSADVACSNPPAATEGARRTPPTCVREGRRGITG